MNIRRYFESMSEPNDTMYIEIGNMHRFTRRGDDWACGYNSAFGADHF